jgi:hypothetical protein
MVNQITNMLQVRVSRFDAPSGVTLLGTYPSIIPNVDVFAISHQLVAPFF